MRHSISALTGKYKNFIKDHDFVRITSDKGRELVDPTFYDFFGNDLCTTTKM